MISDALYEAIEEIDRYLSDETFAEVYEDEALRSRILHVRSEMDALREELDTPPAGEPDDESDEAVNALRACEERERRENAKA